MPLTPLHCGVLAPVNHWFPGKVSTVSFVLVTAWIDAPQIHAALMGIPLPAHGVQHSLVGAMIAAVIVAVPGIRSMKWVLGAYLAALSHVLLDGLVHYEMEPLWPMLEGNPLYIGVMKPLSLVLLPFMLWFIVQTVSACIYWIRQRRAGGVRQQ